VIVGKSYTPESVLLIIMTGGRLSPLFHSQVDVHGDNGRKDLITGLGE
jgi:hypothetical protein